MSVVLVVLLGCGALKLDAESYYEAYKDAICECWEEGVYEWPEGFENQDECYSRVHDYYVSGMEGSEFCIPGELAEHCYDEMEAASSDCAYLMDEACAPKAAVNSPCEE